jgi:cardiolipin synthase A/B
MRRLTGAVAVAALVAGSASACKIPASITSTSTASPGSGTDSAQPSAAASAGAGNGTDTLITEPDQGLSPIYSVMSSAQHTLDMTMYELTDSQAEKILEQDAQRGVQVRVILDQNLEKKSNEPAYTALTNAGVHVVWAPKNFTVTHQKTITVDNDVSVIMTLNLTSQYYSTSRDFAVVDKDPADVAAIEQVFNADFGGTSVTPSAADDLVWSPKQSDTDLISLIDSATKSIVVENEEMADTTVVSALVAAAQRGVSVEVVMTNDSSWKSNFNKLAAAGVKIATYASSASLYIHAKIILVDYDGSSIGSTTKVFLGSENFSTTSLDRNRELGLITTDPAILSSVSSTVAKDFAGGTPWTSS